METEVYTPITANAGQVAAIDLSIIFVNWNSLDLTSAAIASIKQQTSGITYEIFVVDNGTTKDAGLTELPARFPWIKFLANGANLGFSRANNRGITQSCGRYVLVLNNDTVQIENALGKSVQYMDAHSDVGALGILHLNPDQTHSPQASVFQFPDPKSDVLGLMGIASGAPPLPPVPPEGDVDWVCGSFLLMRRECMDQVGLLDERFFIYDEDIDWCKRAHEAGWKVRFWPGAAMLHVGSAAKPFMKDKTFIHFRSHLSYLRKHHSVFAAAAYYAAMGIRLTMASLAQLVRLPLGQTTMQAARERWRRQAQFLLVKPGRMGG